MPGGPAEFFSEFRGVGDKGRRVARPSGCLDDLKINASHFPDSINHLFYRVAVAVAAVENIAAPA